MLRLKIDIMSLWPLFVRLGRYVDITSVMVQWCENTVEWSGYMRLWISINALRDLILNSAFTIASHSYQRQFHKRSGRHLVNTHTNIIFICSVCSPLAPVTVGISRPWKVSAVREKVTTPSRSVSRRLMAASVGTVPLVWSWICTGKCGYCTPRMVMNMYR